MRPKPLNPRLRRDHPLAAGLIFDLPVTDPGRKQGDDANHVLVDRYGGIKAEADGTGWVWRFHDIHGWYLDLSGANGDSIDNDQWALSNGNKSMFWRGTNGGNWSLQLLARWASGQGTGPRLFGEYDEGSSVEFEILSRTGDVARIRMDYDDTTVETHDTTADVLTDEWLDLVVTFDESDSTANLRVYIDGAEDSSVNLTASDKSLTGIDEARVGSRDDNGVSHETDGDISLFRAWQRTLRRSEVAALAEEPYDLYWRPKTILGFVASGSTVSGTAAFTVPLSTQTSSGTVKHTGTASFTLPQSTMDSAGDATGEITGTSTFTAPLSTQSSSGTVKHTGTSTFTAPLSTMSASGTAATSISGTSTFTAPLSTMSASGTATTAITGTATFTAPLSTMSSTGTYTGPPSGTQSMAGSLNARLASRRRSKKPKSVKKQIEQQLARGTRGKKPGNVRSNAPRSLPPGKSFDEFFGRKKR